MFLSFNVIIKNKVLNYFLTNKKSLEIIRGSYKLKFYIYSKTKKAIIQENFLFITIYFKYNQSTIIKNKSSNI